MHKYLLVLIFILFSCDPVCDDYFINEKVDGYLDCVSDYLQSDTLTETDMDCIGDLCEKLKDGNCTDTCEYKKWCDKAQP